MSLKEMESKSTERESELKILDRGDGWFKIQHQKIRNIYTRIDTFE